MSDPERADGIALRLVEGAKRKTAKPDKREPFEPPFGGADRRFMEYEWPASIGVTRSLVCWTYICLDYLQGGAAAGAPITEKKLAAVVGCRSLFQLRKAVAVLEATGWVDIERRPGSSHRYRVKRLNVKTVKEVATSLDELRDTVEVMASQRRSR